MPQRWIQRLNVYFSARWAGIRFQPILYLYLFGASVRLWLNKTEPPNFDDVIAKGFYGVWLGMGMGGPVLALLAWLLITQGSGRKRFIGMWCRMGADIIVFSTLLTFHVVSVQVNAATESRIFSRYMIGAATTFVIGLLIRRNREGAQ